MEEVSTESAPEALGPYSQGIIDGDTVYVSGQGPVDPEADRVTAETITGETEQTLENVAAILEAAGASLDDIVSVNVYMTDMDNYDEINDVYAEYMSEPYPARAAVEVAKLPSDIAVEIEATATLS